jgi:hypothetical protein
LRAGRKSKYVHLEKGYEEECHQIEWERRKKRKEEERERCLYCSEIGAEMSITGSGAHVHSVT